MRPLSDMEKLPIAGLIGAILWYKFMPIYTNSSMLDKIIYNYAGALMIIIPFMALVYSNYKNKKIEGEKIS